MLDGIAGSFVNGTDGRDGRQWSCWTALRLPKEQNWGEYTHLAAAPMVQMDNNSHTRPHCGFQTNDICKKDHSAMVPMVEMYRNRHAGQHCVCKKNKIGKYTHLAAAPMIELDRNSHAGPHYGFQTNDICKKDHLVIVSMVEMDRNSLEGQHCGCQNNKIGKHTHLASVPMVELDGDSDDGPYCGSAYDSCLRFWLSHSFRNGSDGGDGFLVYSTFGESDLEKGELIESSNRHERNHTLIGQPHESRDQYDVIVIGGGFAGMGAALFLGRGLIRTLVVSAESPRNAVTDFSHNYYTRDYTPPATFLKIGKKQLERYSEHVSYIKDFVVDVKKDGGLFFVKTRSGKSYKSDYVMFATGQQDNLNKLNIKGLQECYGKTVWHCPFCDGYDRRNKSIAAFADGAWAVKYGAVMYNWSPDLVLFTSPGSLSAQDKAKFDAKGVRVVEEKAVEIIHTNGKMKGVKLQNGTIISRRFGFLATTMDDGSDLPKSLGVEKLPNGAYKTDPVGRTSVPGVWIVGDLKDKFTGIQVAAGQGNQAAGELAPEILMKRFGL